ncbi:sugar phosphate isomerase/epimerase [Ruegeria sp. Ofav3-42]|uniref:sugar phosphate isomerase/epimerase family protein n=1 Tax=Ruegeria sp. Ofav3-42 TaxID=2917759 RepID=UPI001EF4A7BF|nr:sugar phosphate isomerase/epimerase [Ruegeria sp. Ofav3-42]MCG7520005.1 sugar phosphate isomerase/epimerase [Ruegeria sp. Ofav3-42]
MRVSAQLYTVRKAGDLETQLALVGDCGFTDIETIGFHGSSPMKVAQLAQQAGLTVRSAHFDWIEFETRFEEIVDLLQLLGCPVAVMPWLAPEERPNTSEGWVRMARQLSEWAAGLSHHGVRLAYHNHDFDLLGRTGETPLDIILSHQNLHWQPDLGWLVLTDPNPVELLRRYSDKIVSVHAKDVDPSGGQGDERWRNLGHGVVNWASVLDVLAASNCSDLFVEHDETPNALRTLRTGHKFLSHHLLAGAG